MRTALLLTSGFCVAVALAMAGQAQAQRPDVIWARQAPGAVITLDGILDEPAWVFAEQKVIRYGVENGIPGSGYQEEGGKLAKDSTRATLKFLAVGNQLYIGVTVRDSSVGGGRDFNRFDGLLMGIKNHLQGGSPKGPYEYFYSWWYPDTCDHNPSSVNKAPDFHGRFGNRPSYCDPRSAGQILAWGGGTRIQGTSNDDSGAPDSGYVMEMRVNLDSLGYDITRPQGDVIEWNMTVYDTDWFWPLNLSRFSSNRAWWESPWGLDMWYSQVQIYSKPSVQTNTGVVPWVGPDVYLKPGATTITADGVLSEPVWATADSFHIKYNDDPLRASYPAQLPYRSGQYQPSVNAGTASIFNPGDATVKWFFKSDSLYLGFDVRDEVVQDAGNMIDRWDGFIVTINDRASRWRDRTLSGRRIVFHIGPGGTGVAEDYLLSLRDTLLAAKFGLALKSNTTVDTTGQDVDQGYTAELRIDLTKMGYPPGRGDGVLYIGFDLLDGDSYTPFTFSTASRTWWARQYENDCCPAYVNMGTTAVDVALDDVESPVRFAVLGNAPNPFQSMTMIRYVLDAPCEVSLEVFDLSGRRVASRSLGLQSARTAQYAFSQPGLRTGLYLYRLKASNPVTGASRISSSGKMMLMQ